MNMIVAVDSNWAIGHKGKLLVSIPEDMQFFRRETTGKVVVMGRKTLESFPNGLPLKNRVNVVITKDKEYNVKDAIICHSIEEALEVLKQYNDEDIYVIGGESVYRQFLPYCSVAHVTKINYSYDADTYFPNLDEMDEWTIEESSDERTYFDLEYEFVKYVKK
ncbi:MAG: dihydrofolate reductase [[Bacteroides] pectinophilus]|jgi:dihydrofolate reductase|uniref:Dihydrofolate reductase n=1 Tax=Bacteroides pectinophilus CAG:437 TaxID=1263051 RepID=R7APJ1_9FIRM|nr:dihydrofolate reductase [[Bacteroides] pectinophilus]CDD55331.1 dihydrofolate reductase [Bacteroides pectinophilus CAG:437]HBH93862.1 dihydrofolate reductase [Bacteroides sp.]